MSDRRNEIRLLALWLFLFMGYVYFISLSWPNLAAPDQTVQRYELTRSIVENQELAIPSNIEGMKGIDGKDYSLYGLGFPVLAVPFYLVGKLVGRSADIVLPFVLLLNPFAGAATVVVLFLFSSALGYTRRTSLIVSVLYGLGTFAWPLTKQPFDHTVETLFVLLSIYSMVLYRINKKLRYIVISAVYFGVAINTRLVSLMALPALFILMSANRGDRLNFSERVKQYCSNVTVFTIAFAPFATIVLLYNLARFGSIFETGFQLYSAKTGLDFFSGTSLISGLYGFLLSPGKGFFYYSPITILFFFALIRFYKHHKDTAISFFLLTGSYILFHSRLLYWHGDWAWGPRYLLAVTPYLVLPIGEIFDADLWKKKVLRVTYLIYPLMVFSILIQIAAVSVHYYKHFFHLNIDKKIQFVRTEAKGVPTINQPPQGVYLDWAMSPIILQFQYVEEIGSEIANYRYVESATDTIWGKEIEDHPAMNLYDFWWIYMYYVKEKYFGFIGLFLCLFVVCVAGYRISKLLNT